MADVSAAFQQLRPICILVTQEHNLTAITNLEQMLLKKTFSDSVLQELHEYIAFPLRLVLKQYAARDEAVCVKSLECLTTLLSKVSIQKASIFLDLFSNILHFISSPNRKAGFPEEVKLAAVEALNPLFANCLVSCYSTLLKESLPLYGGLVAGLLDITAKEKLIKLRLFSLQLLLVLLNSRRDKELTELLELIIPSYLPGISLNLTKVITASGEKSKILVAALELMQSTLITSLSGDQDCSEDAKHFINLSSGDGKFIVSKTKEWYDQVSKNISAVVKKVAGVCMNHPIYSVRLGLLKWSHRILLNCNCYLEGCQGVLLDVITHSICDVHEELSSHSQASLRDVQDKVEGVSEVLKQRLYDVVTTLPRKVSRYNETGGLSALKIFNGYLNSLKSEVDALLRCHSHLRRIGLALCQLLQLDITAVSILDSSQTETHKLTAGSEEFPVLRRQFTSFADNSVWREIRTAIHTIIKYSDTYLVADYFVTDFQCCPQNRLQCAIILNECVLYHIRPSQEEGKEGSRCVVDTCRSILELYTDWYRRLQSEARNGSRLSISQRNENTQLHCFILEGFVAIHEVTGENYPELLLHSLYSILESCSHDNVLIKQTAVTGLAIVSQALHYSGTGELIEKHSNYLCNALSLNIRRLQRYPTSPSVLSSILIHSQSTILPYIDQIIIEVLLTMDENYADGALSLLKVLQTLTRQLSLWFSREPSGHVVVDFHQAIRDVRETSAQEVSKRISDYVIDYYKTRLAADDVNLALEEEDLNEEEAHETVEKPMPEVEKKEPPLFFRLTKKVLDRCRHLISHSNPQIRLLTINIIQESLTVISHSQDELLPAVHEVWPGFAKRFSDSEPLVVIQATHCLTVLGHLSKDFVRVRVGKEIIPAFTDLLQKRAVTSMNTGKAYRHTLDYRLQVVLLETIGKLCIDLKLSFNLLQSVVLACLPYLSVNQPVKLQQASLSSLQQISSEDGHLVWYLANNFSSKVCRLVQERGIS
ncbi:TELO2-interacting protein 1 homolog isoform X2 [Watersipora subatra]|uniref:TELO2-interacting protein 1 homolog isoform X2 n=1 Tax=Watersipora subatra TaxID=2589382 RepID=UPI00355BF3F3